MHTPPIHITAARTIEFTPRNQDAEAYRARHLRQIQKEREALRRREQTLRHRQREGLPDAAPNHRGFEDEERAIIAESRRLSDEETLLERDVQSMRDAYPIPQVFTLTVPTSIERDGINSRLIQLGLSQVTQEQIRATIIEELFNLDWSEGRPLDPQENEAVAEANAMFLDGYWQRKEAHDEVMQRWREQEVERVLDEMEGAPRRDRDELPPKIISMREEARAQIMIQKVMSASERMRGLAADNIDFQRRSAMLYVRMHVVGMTGPGAPDGIAVDPRSRALPEATAVAIREAVDDPTFQDLIAYIDSMYSLSVADVKNSDSLPENSSLPNGSTEPTGDLGSSDGNSTISSSTPVPADASAMTTDRSSGSTTGSNGTLASSVAEVSRMGEV